MQHHILRPRQALNKAYLRLKTSRADMEQFKAGLRAPGPWRISLGGFGEMLPRP